MIVNNATPMEIVILAKLDIPRLLMELVSNVWKPVENVIKTNCMNVWNVWPELTALVVSVITVQMDVLPVHQPQPALSAYWAIIWLKESACKIVLI